jgi:hypothetical protein
MPGFRQIISKRDVVAIGEDCESCKREATHLCSQKVGVLMRCGVPLCDDCSHYTDKRVPVHDRDGADRSSNKWLAEQQAEELMEIGTLASGAMEAAKERMTPPPSKKEMKRARDDLVQLLDELGK